MTWQLLYLKTIATNKKIQLQNTHPTSKTSCQAKRNEDKYHSTQSASLAKLQMMTVVSVDMDVGQPEYSGGEDQNSMTFKSWDHCSVAEHSPNTYKVPLSIFSMKTEQNKPT